jgi:hypothetical protein
MPTRIARKLPRAAGLIALAASLGLAVATAAPASGALSKKVTSSQLKALQNEISKGKKLTYSVTYASLENGTASTVTIAQSPPKSVFITSTGGEVVNTGSKTYYCSKNGATTSCFNAGGTNPFLGIENFFSPTVALTALSEAKQGLVEKALGINAKVTTATYGGQSSTCVTVTTHNATTGTYCVTKQGLLSYAGANGSYFKLTHYSSSPSSSLFQLPAGATTVTLPGGVSIP